MGPDMEQRGLIFTAAYSKGGTGKSNLNANIAAAMAHKGASVVVIDADPQGTISNWIDRRNSLLEEGNKELPVIHLQQSFSSNTRKIAIEAAKHYDVVIIDVDGRDGKGLRHALMACDIAIAPLEPSQESVEKMDAFMEVLADTQDLNPDRIVKTMLVRVDQHDKYSDFKEAKKFLMGFEEVELMQLYTSQFKAYKRSIAAGLSVIEWNHSKAKAQIQLLADKILDMASLGEKSDEA